MLLREGYKFSCTYSGLILPTMSCYIKKELRKILGKIFFNDVLWQIHYEFFLSWTEYTFEVKIPCDQNETQILQKAHPSWYGHRDLNSFAIAACLLCIAKFLFTILYCRSIDPIDCQWWRSKFVRPLMGNYFFYDITWNILFKNNSMNGSHGSIKFPFFRRFVVSNSIYFRYTVKSNIPTFCTCPFYLTLWPTLMLVKGWYRILKSCRTYHVRSKSFT